MIQRWSSTWRLLLAVSIVGLASCRECSASSYVEKVDWIPMTDGEGAHHQLYARLCFPSGSGPFRLAIVNHGSPPNTADRPNVQPMTCGSEVAQWFLARNFAVVFAVRRGYGATGGEWAEGFGRCDRPDYVRAGFETARDIDAIVEYATALPKARPDGAVVVGHSAGGWGTVAYNAMAHPKVAAFIDMAGGRGGHGNAASGENCRPAALTESAARYGRSATTPMLWIYAANDSFFGPDIATDMHAAFVQGGGTAKLLQVDAFGADGHGLFLARRGSRVWGPAVEAYLAEQLSPTP